MPAARTPRGDQENLYWSGLSAASGAGRPPQSDWKLTTWRVAVLGQEAKEPRGVSGEQVAVPRPGHGPDLAAAGVGVVDHLHRRQVINSGVQADLVHQRHARRHRAAGLPSVTARACENKLSRADFANSTAGATYDSWSCFMPGEM